jgi:hypothetical protein
VNYPTAADLRAAANEATLRRCDDPLLPEIMASAASAAAQGETSCRLEFPATLEDRRRDNVILALGALGVQAYWDPMLSYDTVTLYLSWN